MQIVGVGLNKTGTKTMRAYCLAWGCRHRSYELEAFQRYRGGEIGGLLDELESYDSCEDWPWPLMYREIDERFPDAKFVLTVRRDPETWYRSLCKMAVRMGPLNDYEKHIYGYSMPHGRMREHIAFYEAHNRAVEEHFKDRPGKLLRLCWESGDNATTLADFLGKDVPDIPEQHVNSSARVYGGDNLWLAHLCRIEFQTRWHARRLSRHAWRSVRASLPGGSGR